MQIIYLGSNCEIKNPEIRITKYNKDFGFGFYCTILKEQAIKWANKYDKSIVNLYEYVELKNTGYMYELIGVVTHMGESGSSGHFIS